MAEHKSSVLLDAKSNELEIIEFSVGDKLYGINVAKVREIINAGVLPICAGRLFRLLIWPGTSG